ncbi:MAG TPA: GvpL/GvpF family gas vesicle protein, partial [Gemmatimonadaceae bacterium]|nr:GvpL/GvpF family gas vesicle protein [Gemmatimonadaceae bacterium]
DAPADRAVTVARVQAHDGVVSAALRTGRTPLPVRFGQRFADSAALVGTIEGMVAPIQEALGRVAGLVEMSVVIAPEHARLQPVRSPEHVNASEPGAGHRYLTALRRRAAEAGQVDAELQAAADRLRVAVVGISISEGRDAPRHDPPSLAVAHLISREAIETFRSAAGPLDRSEGWRYLITGPQAPYSFSSVVVPDAPEARFWRADPE